MTYLVYDDIDTSRCPSNNLVYDNERGIIVCLDNGEVLNDIAIDMGPEWRAYTYDEYVSRARASSVFVPGEEPPSTNIGQPKQQFRSLREKMIAMHLNRTSRRYSRANKGNNSIERLINVFATKLNIPQYVVDEALNICRKIRKSNLLRGSVRSNVIAATCIYIACRLCNVPRSLKEFTTALEISKKDITCWYKRIINELEMNANYVSYDVEQYIKRLCNVLNMKSTTVEKALEIYRAVKNTNITSGKNPAGIAAAVVYLVGLLSNDRRTMKEIASVANITEVTIRKRVREIMDALNIKL